VSCVPNVASVSELYILDCLIGFLWRLITTNSLSCVLCTQCFQCLWTVHSWLPHWFSLTFIYYQLSVLCLVYPMLPVSLDCTFLITPSVSLNVYLLPTVCPVSCVPNVASVSGLYILDYTFGFSNVYLLPTVCPVSCVTNVASVYGLYMLDCLIDFL
jgi:hypothetical protein